MRTSAQTTGTPPQATPERPWPAPMRERITAVRGLLHENAGHAFSATEITARFTGACRSEVTSILETLVLLGMVWELEDGRVVG